MQSVTAAFTAEERDSVRKIAQSTQVSWKKFSTLNNRTFTIGVSTIGGNDIIGVNPGSVGSPGNYKYFDETQYVMGLTWERGLNIPAGGITKAMASVDLDNTSGRFTPRYMGGNSELFTSVYLPTRPIIINAGFNFNGVDQTIPQFAGQTEGQAEIDMRERQVRLRAFDFVEYFSDKKLDQAVMFTAQRTDQVMTTLFSRLGMNTAQYDLDVGINNIPFGMFPVGTSFAAAIGGLVEAENGHFYQDESGIFKFENRQHWDSSPYTQVQRVITTGQVINAQGPDTDHLINVVEISGEIITKQPNQVIFQLSQPLEIASNADTTLFVNFDDPILQVQTISGYEANTLADGSGTSLTSSVSIASTSIFAQAAKVVFRNSSSLRGFITQLYIYGRPARKTADLYYRARDDSSVTAFQEKTFRLENPYIQNQSWAESYANMILQDFSNPENLQRITIRAVPELQLGDLISWQGRYWRIFDIKTTLEPSRGFIQDLTLLQRTITSYFRIGISTIGGTDRIAP